MSAAHALIPRGCRGCGTAYGLAAARGIADQVDHAGQRRNWVAASARLGRLVAGGHLDATFAETLVVDLADLIGRERSEAHKTWRWALREGAKNPARPGPNQVTSDSLVDDVLRWWAAVTTDATLTEARSGAAARKILGGVMHTALAAHRVEFGMSLRQMAERAGVALSTVKRTRSLWTRHVRIAKPGDRRRAERATLRLAIPLDDAHSEPIAGGSVQGHSPDGVKMRAPSSTDLDAPGGNLWHRCPGCWATWNVLDVAEPATPAQIAKAIGRAVGTVRRILNGMERDGLAVRSDSGWCRVPDADEPPGPDHAAERRQRHADERDLYRRSLARRKTG